MAPEEEVSVIVDARQRASHERDLIEREALCEIVPEKLLESLMLLRLRQEAPIEFRPWQLDLRRMDDLHRLVEQLPLKRGTQNCMAVHQVLPCLAEAARIDGACNAAAELIEAGGAPGMMQSMEEHRPLHRRKLVHVRGDGGRCHDVARVANAVALSLWMREGRGEAAESDIT